MADIVVVGSCNQDLISYIPRFPDPGQDVMGTKFKTGFGGKGANQAVMAARLGGRTAMVAKVGNDIFGQPTVDNLRNNGININHVLKVDKATTGTANILVDESGQNSIVVVLGANLCLTVEDIRNAEQMIANAKVVVCQLEINQDVALETLKLAKKHGVTTIFNPAPAPANGLPDEFFKYSDIICPNETEAGSLVGFPLKNDNDLERALAALLQRGTKTAIITLGEKGCIFANEHIAKTIVPAPKVFDTIDTTGAGDAFVGALAYYIAYHKIPVEECIRRSCRIASATVQSQGTQTSYPLKEKLPTDLFQ